MNKLGLIFSGEGCKSAYHMGIWKAIIEWEMVEDISMVLGTSTGILNCILFSAQQYDLAKESWTNIKSRDIVKPDTNVIIRKLPSHLHKKYITTCTFAESSVKSALNTCLNSAVMSNLNKSNIKVYACLYNHTQKCLDYFLLNELDKSEIIEIVLAGIAIPGVQSSHYINQYLYFDGGLQNNIPLKPFSEDKNIDSVIVSHFNDKIQIEPEYKNIDIIEIVPDNNELFNDNLNISVIGINKRMKKGYNDAIRMFDLVYRGLVE